MNSKIAPLSCPLCNSSLVPSMARQKRERRGRRRTTLPDQNESKDVPAVELEADADMLFQNLTDLIISAILTCLDEEKPRIEELLKEICGRRYFDSMYQSFITPTGLTRDHVAFIIANDPVISRMYRLQDGIVIEC